MAPGHTLNAIDQILQEIMTNDKPFGGKVLIFGGDFRQTLPVVCYGERTATVEASIKSHHLWHNFHILRL